MKPLFQNQVQSTIPKLHFDKITLLWKIDFVSNFILVNLFLGDDYNSNRYWTSEGIIQLFRLDKKIKCQVILGATSRWLMLLLVVHEPFVIE